MYLIYSTLATNWPKILQRNMIICWQYFTVVSVATHVTDPSRRGQTSRVARGLYPLDNSCSCVLTSLRPIYCPVACVLFGVCLSYWLVTWWLVYLSVRLPEPMSPGGSGYYIYKVVT